MSIKFTCKLFGYVLTTWNRFNINSRPPAASCKHRPLCGGRAERLPFNYNLHFAKTTAEYFCFSLMPTAINPAVAVMSNVEEGPVSQPHKESRRWLAALCISVFTGLPDCTALQPPRRATSYSRPREPQILYGQETVRTQCCTMSSVNAKLLLRPLTNKLQ
jgi:hypothetical protein